MFAEGKGRESFWESRLVKNAGLSVQKRLPTLCTHPVWFATLSDDIRESITSAISDTRTSFRAEPK